MNEIEYHHTSKEYTMLMKNPDVCFSCRFFQKLNNGDIDGILGYCTKNITSYPTFGNHTKCKIYNSWK